MRSHIAIASRIRNLDKADHALFDAWCELAYIAKEYARAGDRFNARRMARRARGLVDAFGCRVRRPSR